MPSSSRPAISSEVAIGRRMKIVEKPTGGSLLVRRAALDQANAGRCAGVRNVGRARSARTAAAASTATLLLGGLELGLGRRGRRFARLERGDLGARLEPELALAYDPLA